MQRINTAQLFELCSHISRVKTYFEADANKTYIISEETRQGNIEVMENHGRHFAELSLPMCKLQCDEISVALRTELKGSEYGNLLAVLQGRMEHETTLTQGFLLTPAETALYLQKAPLFGVIVTEKFPSANDDIEEAGKCLALGRGTATVMHLMRVMEVGLKALAKPLGIPYAPSWESYLRQINDKMALPHKKKGTKWRKREPFFRDVSGDLVSVKHVWRNPTMHVVRKYDPEEAEEILRAVRRFMQRLADGLA